MSVESFTNLVETLGDALNVDEHQGRRRGGHIEPALRLFCTIRWLAGGSYLDIAGLVGVSSSRLYQIIDKTIHAIATSSEPALDNIRFPKTTEECEAAAGEFLAISRGSAVSNCVSVHDGYLLRIQTPSAGEVGNVRSYFSGHYQCNGVNVQAACDAHCRFLFIGVAGPGVVVHLFSVFPVLFPG
ncbi:hypothetical protein IV203_008946 [Nitzschia inconspicua]|uniref:DDE Tnp4 domain-containing protein n=1 Tax=Nitzschia inconspicua TaxID=303405 RepID=A0A9K3KZL7_9STRA|nr:hypothetical protein IV203_008946 [Nitzschia inconspicua]